MNSLKKINQKVIKFCNVKIYNNKVYLEKSKYKQFRNEKAELVRNAKRIITNFQQINHTLICCVKDCDNEIWSNGILHHFHYDWLNLYNINDCRIICDDCNNQSKTHKGLLEKK